MLCSSLTLVSSSLAATDRLNLEIQSRADGTSVSLLGKIHVVMLNITDTRFVLRVIYLLVSSPLRC